MPRPYSIRPMTSSPSRCRRTVHPTGHSAHLQGLHLSSYCQTGQIQNGFKAQTRSVSPKNCCNSEQERVVLQPFVVACFLPDIQKQIITRSFFVAPSNSELVSYFFVQLLIFGTLFIGCLLGNGSCSHTSLYQVHVKLQNQDQIKCILLFICANIPKALLTIGYVL